MTTKPPVSQGNLWVSLQFSCSKLTSCEIGLVGNIGMDVAVARKVDNEKLVLIRRLARLAQDVLDLLRCRCAIHKDHLVRIYDPPAVGAELASNRFCVGARIPQGSERVDVVVLVNPDRD